MLVPRQFHFLIVMDKFNAWMCPRNSHPKAILYSCCCEFLMHESVLEIMPGTEYTATKLKNKVLTLIPATSWNINWNLEEEKVDNSGWKESTQIASSFFFFFWLWIHLGAERFRVTEKKGRRNTKLLRKRSSRCLS